MVFPHVIIVGAPKCATTSLYHYLQEHPDIFMSPFKESSFFIRNIYRNLHTKDHTRGFYRRHTPMTWHAYEQLFCEAKPGQVIGDASVGYLPYHKEAIPNIKRFVGDPKIIIMLRDPIQRTYSSFRHMRMETGGPSRFDEYLGMDSQGNGNWSVLYLPITASRYARAVSQYLHSFSDVKIILAEELRRYPLTTMREIYSWLGVAENHVPDVSTHHNRSYIPRSRTLQRFLDSDTPIMRTFRHIARKSNLHNPITSAIDTINTTKDHPQDIEPEHIRHLFTDDIQELNRMGIDLPWWDYAASTTLTDPSKTPAMA